MPDITIQQQTINIIQDKQQQLDLTDAALVAGIMTYHRWWRVKNRQHMLTHVEVVQLMQRVGLMTQYVKPKEVHNAIPA